LNPDLGTDGFNRKDAESAKRAKQMDLQEQGVKSSQAVKTRRKLPRGCYWLLCGCLLISGLFIVLLIAVDVYVDRCGFPYVEHIQSHSLASDVISASNAPRLTELAMFHDGDVWSNSQNRSNLAFSPDGQWLAVGGSKQWGSGYSCGSIWLIDTTTQSAQVIAREGLGSGLAFSPGGDWLFVNSYQIDAFSLPDLSQSYNFDQHQRYDGTGFNISFFNNGFSDMLLVSSNKQIPYFWDYAQRRKIATPLTPDIVTASAASKDYIAYGTADEDIKLYRISERATTILARDTPAYKLTFNKDGSLLGVDSNRSNMIFDVETGKKLFEENSRSELVFSPDDRFFATSSGVWTLADQKSVFAFDDAKYSYAYIRFSPTGDLLAIATPKGLINIWDVATHQLAFSIKNDHKALSDIDFSPDGRLIAASFGGSDFGTGEVKIWGIPQR
jgi:WD40 repeat protein